MPQTYLFCRNCQGINTLSNYDYSGGPGVAKCGSCGRKNTITEVPKELSKRLVEKVSYPPLEWWACL